MKDSELIEILGEVAEIDLADGSDIYDHPCSCAIRRINELKKLNKKHISKLKKLIEFKLSGE